MEEAQLVPLPYSQERSTRYSDRLYGFCVIFFVPFLDVTRMFMLTVYFPAPLDSGNLHIECFPSTYNLSAFKSRINRHLLTIVSLSKEIFCLLLSFCTSFSHNFIPCSGCSALYGVNVNSKKKTVTNYSKKRESVWILKQKALLPNGLNQELNDI